MSDDQHNIDPAEGNSSGDKRRGGAKIPGTGIDAAELEERKQRARDAAERQKKHDGDGQTADRVDEASRESFPASDPPAVP